LGGGISNTGRQRRSTNKTKGKQMILDSQKIIEIANTIIGVRNQVRAAIAAREQIITVPAVAASDINPGKPASEKATGHLPNANNNLFVVVTNLVGHLKNIGGTDADVSAIEKALNAPLSPAPAATKTAASQAPAATTPASAAVK
jgi:hypothetical protein